MPVGIPDKDALQAKADALRSNAKASVQTTKNEVVKEQGYLRSMASAVGEMITGKSASFQSQVETQRDSRKNSGRFGATAGSNIPSMYPQELFGPSQPNGIHFYINARSNSAAAISQSEAGTLPDQGEYQAAYTKENRAKAEAYEQTLANTGALAAGLSTATAISSGKIFEGGSGLGKTLGTVGTAALGYVGGKAIGRAKGITTVRLADEIMLYVPQSVITQYQANYDQAELGLAGLLTTGRGGVTDFLSGEGAETVARGVAGAVANVPKAAGVNADFNAAIEATSKKVANPFKEQLFKSMGFRKFSFSYTFSPRNVNEQLVVDRIIQLFKYHMHPTNSDLDQFLIYPSEFSIIFEHTNKEGKVVVNENMPKISSCVLEGMKVVHGPDGLFNTFQNSQGAPSEITMELNFAELETLTAKRIEQGF